MKVDGWKIYQYSYDTRMGKDNEISIFQLVKDPWLPLVYAGIFMMLAGAFFAWKDRRTLVFTFTSAGIAIFFAFILGMWTALERPPLRTMGETRLWYSFFMPVAGIIVYSRWKYKWILSFSTLMALVFICVNLFKPGIHSKTLMPALQSPWFAPHVIVYMFSYALFGAATLAAIYLLARKAKAASDDEMNLADNLVYLHIRKAKPSEWKTACVILLLSFVCLQICWWGINYLPSAQGLSIHTYNMK